MKKPGATNRTGLDLSISDACLHVRLPRERRFYSTYSVSPSLSSRSIAEFHLGVYFSEMA